METSDVSLLIPTFNRQHFLERSIRSALKNRNLCPNMEIVVIDDGSTDSTQQILKKFGNDIQVVNHSKNQGLPSALNSGIIASSGQFIVRLDADDFILPEYTYILSTFLKHNNLLDAVRCDYFLIDSRESIQRAVNAEEEPIGCGIMFRREHLIDIGLYNPEYRLHEDKELENRFIKKYSITRLPIPLYKYFLHGSNMTMA